MLFKYKKEGYSDIYVYNVATCWMYINTIDVLQWYGTQKTFLNHIWSPHKCKMYYSFTCIIFYNEFVSHPCQDQGESL